MQNKTEVAQGVESIEFGFVGANWALPTSWILLDNIADGSVSYTSNKDTQTAIIPEDKDVALLTLYTPGDADTFNFDLLELSEANFSWLFNISQNLATSMTSVLAERLRANVAIRLTTRPQLGLKKQFVFMNTVCNPSYKNNFTKNALVAISVEAAIYSYPDPVSGVDTLYTIQTLNADGTIIDQTLPTVSAGAPVAVATGTTTANLVGTASADGTNTIASTKWTKKTGATATIASPNSLTTAISGLAPGTYVFTLTATDNIGNTNSSDVTVTVAA